MWEILSPLTLQKIFTKWKHTWRSEAWINPAIPPLLLLRALSKGQKANVNNGVSAWVFVTNAGCPCSCVYFYQCPYVLLKYSLGEKSMRETAQCQLKWEMSSMSRIPWQGNCFEITEDSDFFRTKLWSCFHLSLLNPLQCWTVPWDRWHKGAF